MRGPLRRVGGAVRRATEELLALLSEVSAVATAHEADEALPHLLYRIGETTGASACQIDATGPDQRWSTVLSLGYPAAVSEHLRANFIPAFHGRRVLEAVAALRIQEDDPYNFRNSYHYLDVLRPAGFVDGISIALRRRDRSTVGMLHLSAPAEDDFHEQIMKILPSFGPAVARLTDLVISPQYEPLPEGFRAARWVNQERFEPVPGYGDPLPLLSEQLRRLVAALAALEQEMVTCLVLTPEGVHQLRIVRSPAAAHEVIVGLRKADPGLTLRQLEVLTEVATGATNQEIGEALGLAPRTVAAHVEAILERVGRPNRTAAAVHAYGAGLLLPSPDPTSTRAVSALFTGPQTP